MKIIGNKFGIKKIKYIIKKTHNYKVEIQQTE